MAFASRLAIIAGGVGGIGSVTAHLLRSRGAKLALLYAPFQESSVQAALAQYPDYSPHTNDIRAYACDITSPTSVTAAFDAIATAAAAHPAILVNAAGYITLAPLETFPPDLALQHLTVNLYGPLLTAQAFARLYLAHARAASPPGRIVNIASQAAHVALPDHGPYSASKAGLLGLTRAMASEWGPRGITANSVSPGPVWTELGKRAWSDRAAREAYQAAVPTGRFAEPGEVARVVGFLCEDGCGNVNGDDVRVEGGYTAR